MKMKVNVGLAVILIIVGICNDWQGAVVNAVDSPDRNFFTANTNFHFERGKKKRFFFVLLFFNYVQIYIFGKNNK